MACNLLFFVCILKFVIGFPWLIAIFSLGAAVGSFLSAFTFRLPKGESVILGRSYCDHCKKKIAWYDNLPLLSYINLRGKCRSCHKKISLRYPAIELVTGVTFVTIFVSLNNCSPQIQTGGTICGWYNYLGLLALPFFLVIASALLSVFIIDLEGQVIPDSLVFFLFLITLFALLFSSTSFLFSHLFAGFLVALFLLVIHLATRGQGMGLGDVKFALFAGTLAGWPLAVIWLYGSFLIGAIAGITLIAVGRARFGARIAFGPFLVISTAVTLIWGQQLTELMIILLA